MSTIVIPDERNIRDLVGKHLVGMRFLWLSEIAFPPQRRKPPTEDDPPEVREAYSFISPEPVNMHVLISSDAKFLEKFRRESPLRI
jgi:hypothetical protein